MQTYSFKSFWLFTIFQIGLLAILSLWLYQQNQAVSLVSPELGESQKLQCVSYAPYYGKDQSPMVPGITISKAQIDADLEKLAKITNCVRTYSVSQGMDYVPVAAKKNGLTVYLGAWIGWTDVDNIIEVNLAVKTANAHPNTVKAIIIGNEVFLRQEQDEVAMKRYLALAKEQTNIPLTYAEVWEFWKKHPSMEQHVDFITIHLLPYWENDPVNIANGAAHASNVMANVQAAFKKPVLIGETGWPSVGRQREESKPSLINQARYIREFLQSAHQNNWQYNIIEAIDQPWKRTLEGTVGGYWGVYDTDLKPKFSLTAPVAERNDQTKPYYFAFFGALILLGLALAQQEKRYPVLIGFTALGATAGLTSMLQAQYLIAACRDISEWLALGGFACIGWIGIAVLPKHIKTPTAFSKSTIRFVLIALVIASIITSFLLYTDGRYRDFPNFLMALPALAIPLSLLLTHTRIQQSKLMIVPMTITIAMAYLAISLESNNHTALFWAFLSINIALVHWPAPSTQQEK